MGHLVAGFASSHGIMVTSELEDWLHHFSAFDRTVPLIGPLGYKHTFEELLARAPENAAAHILPEKLIQRYGQMQHSIDRLRTDISQSELDALIVVGDDQEELFDSSNMPAFAIYSGETIPNSVRSHSFAESWIERAKNRRLEPDCVKEYPVHTTLARHLIEHLHRHKFDPTVLHRLPPGKGESHAMSFVHRYFLQGVSIPVVPVFLNSFFPPNQPTPQRCLEIGRAIAAAVQCFPSNLRVGILASGGLSHFVVDEELDRRVIEVLGRGDVDALGLIPEYKLQSGTSEIRNWICVAGAIDRMPLVWVQYIPGYRTPALTGTGLGFAKWALSEGLTSTQD